MNKFRAGDVIALKKGCEVRYWDHKLDKTYKVVDQMSGGTVQIKILDNVYLWLGSYELIDWQLIKPASELEKLMFSPDYGGNEYE